MKDNLSSYKAILNSQMLMPFFRKNGRKQKKALLESYVLYQIDEQPVYCGKYVFLGLAPSFSAQKERCLNFFLLTC
jgi:hypothetical protein